MARRHDDDHVVWLFRRWWCVGPQRKILVDFKLDSFGAFERGRDFALDHLVQRWPSLSAHVRDLSLCPPRIESRGDATEWAEVLSCDLSIEVALLVVKPLELALACRTLTT